MGRASRMAAAAALIATTALSATAHAHYAPSTAAQTRAANTEPCPGDPIAPSKVLTGSFPAALQGSYVMLPFTVPDGTTAVRVKYCFDQPESPANAQVRHTLDLGLWGPRRFRGWGGSSHPDVTVSREGFSSEEQYLERPKGHVPGRTTRGFIPGRIKDGRWQVELGAMAIAGRDLGDADGAVAWRVEIELSDDPAFKDRPYRKARYDERPAKVGRSWWAGDFHVHAEHSALGDATMRETFDYAFGPAGLDFITLSDYVTTSAWGEIGRHQRRYPGKLVARSAEVITPKGHTNNHVSGRYVDHRTGPVLEWRPDGEVKQIRPATSPSRIFDAVRSAGGFTQINHPTIFPSQVPGFSFQCRGCPWDHETDYAQVDAIEVATGPAGIQDAGEGLLGPNPFTVLALDFYDRALDRGPHIAAVGSSDSHNAGRTNNPVTQAPIGMATTIVRAKRLSERGIRCGVRRGHTYVKLWGADGPDLRFTATAGEARAIMGDTLRADRAAVRAEVLNGEPGMLLQVTRDGEPHSAVPVAGGETVHSFAATPGRYRLQVTRGTSIDAVSTPIWIEPGSGTRAPRRSCG